MRTGTKNPIRMRLRETRTYLRSPPRCQIPCGSSTRPTEGMTRKRSVAKRKPFPAKSYRTSEKSHEIFAGRPIRRSRLDSADLVRPPIKLSRSLFGRVSKVTSHSLKSDDTKQFETGENNRKTLRRTVEDGPRRSRRLVGKICNCCHFSLNLNGIDND